MKLNETRNMELADQFWLRSCQTKLIAGLAQ